jgi:hypothetical protein
MKGDDLDNLLKSATKYIESQGGKVVVIGGIRVRQRSDGRLFNYELVIDFTGNVDALIEASKSE